MLRILRPIALASVCSFVACSSDDEQRAAPKTPQTPDAGGGTGGSAGTSGSAGTAGSGGTDGSVRCGTATCLPVTVSSRATLAACCPPGTMDRCGLDVTTAAALVGLSAGCIELDQPGTSDASCPALSPS